MGWLQTIAAPIFAIGMGIFYFLMDMTPRSPRRIHIKGGITFQMPDMRLRPTPDALYQTFALAGDERPRMRRYWLLDFGFIACFWVVMIAIGQNVANGSATFALLMLIAATARALLDVTENSLLLALYRTYPKRNDRLAQIACTVTTAKFVFLFLWAVLLLASFIVSRV